MAESLVEPNANAETPDQAGSLPAPLLQIPAMQALLAGSPPALSTTNTEAKASPELKTILGEKDALLKAGLGLYRALSGDVGVIFNALFINPADLQAADKQGKLAELAPNFNQVNSSVAASGAENPALSAGPPPTGARPPTPMAPPQMGGMVAPASAASQRSILAQRMKTMNPGAPTSGPAPGAGRILNQILKPVV